MPRPHTQTARPDAESGEEVMLTPRQQSALQAGLNDLWVSYVSIDFNQRLISALLSGRDMRPWHEQVGTRLRWMLPAVVVGFSVALTLAYQQNLPQQIAADKPAFPSFSTPALPPLPPMPTRFVAAQTAKAEITMQAVTKMKAVKTMQAVKAIKQEDHHESR